MKDSAVGIMCIVYFGGACTVLLGIASVVMAVVSFGSIAIFKGSTGSIVAMSIVGTFSLCLGLVLCRAGRCIMEIAKQLNN